MAFIHVEHQLINVDHIVKAVYDDKVIGSSEMRLPGNKKKDLIKT